MEDEWLSEKQQVTNRPFDDATYLYFYLFVCLYVITVKICDLGPSSNSEFNWDNLES